MKPSRSPRHNSIVIVVSICIIEWTKGGLNTRKYRQTDSLCLKEPLALHGKPFTGQTRIRPNRKRWKKSQRIVVHKNGREKRQNKTKPESHYKRLDDIMTCRCSFTMIVTHLTVVFFILSSSPTDHCTISHTIKLWTFEPVNLNKYDRNVISKKQKDRM